MLTVRGSVGGVVFGLAVALVCPLELRGGETSPASVDTAPDTLSEAEAAWARLRDPFGRVNAEEAGAMLPLFDRAVEREPGSSRWRVARAAAQRVSGDANGSLASLRAVVKAHPRDAQARYELGQTLMATLTQDTGFMKMADIAGSAKDAWEEAVKLDPDHVMARYAAGMYWLQARRQGGWLFGSYDKARAHGEAMVKIGRDMGPYWGNLLLGSVAAAQEKWADMQRHFDAASADAGDNKAAETRALVSAAIELVNSKKDGPAAMPFIRRLREIAPTDMSAAYLHAEALRLQNDCAGAVDAYLEVLAQNPEARNTRFNIAECLAKLGDRARAVEHYEEFISRFPKDDRVSKAKKEVRRLRG